MRDIIPCTNLWLITAELSVAVRKPLQTNGELDVATADNFLDLVSRKLGVEAESLNDTSVVVTLTSSLPPTSHPSRPCFLTRRSVQSSRRDRVLEGERDNDHLEGSFPSVLGDRQPTLVRRDDFKLILSEGYPDLQGKNVGLYTRK